MTTFAFLLRLMSYTKLSRSLKIGEEDREALTFANALRAATLEGRLDAVWLHPANELAGITRKTPKGYRTLPQVALARALGLITGTSDYVFLRSSGALAIEFKSARGSLRLAQRDFRDWCEARGVPFHVVRSAEDGLQILRDAGALS